MKAFDLDWAEVFRALPVWSELLPAVRRAMLDHLKPSGSHPAAPLADELPALTSVGLAEPSPTGVRVSVPEPARPLVKLLRAMDRARVWEEPTEEAAARYVDEHLSSEESRALGALGGYAGWGWNNRAVVAGMATSAEWVQEFLACRTRDRAEAWEAQRQGRGEEPRRFHVREVHEATQALVRALLSFPEGVRLADLPRVVPGIGRPVLAAALHAALRYLLVYAALDEALEPRVGLWPAIVHRLSRPEPVEPRPVEASEEFHVALLMEDMTAVLVSAAAEPIRLRGNDGEVFARAQQAIAQRLVSLPGWVESLLEYSPSARIADASGLLQALKLAGVQGEAGKDLRLAPTRRGLRWLEESEHDRLAAVVDPLRKSKEHSPAGWDRPAWSFFPLWYGYEPPLERGDLRALLSEAFLSLPDDRFVPLADFLDYQARVRNPLLEAARAGLKLRHVGSWGGPPPRPEALERSWAALLANFLAQRLVALGGARLGRTADGQIAFALASPGRYLLGAVDDFRYGVEPAGTQVVVQPNFEVVFLALAPRVEAQIARFAQRVGAGPGVMFRITRQSVLAAAEAGMPLGQLQRVLEEASTLELPANVARQIRDWYGEVRRVRLRRTVLIDCPDAETAARVRAAGGREVHEITPTLLELRDTSRKTSAAVVRQLRLAGIFVEGAE